MKYFLISTLKFLLSFAIISFLAGFTSCILYPSCVVETVDTNSFWGDYGLAAIGTFLTYIIYVAAIRSPTAKSQLSIFEQSIVCLGCFPVFWSVILTMTYGLDLRANLLVFISIGIPNFITPYLDRFLNILLGLPNISIVQ